MENFLQTDLPVRDPLDLDGPADWNLAPAYPLLDGLGFDGEFPRQDGLIAEIADNVCDRKRGRIHGEKFTR